MKSEATEEPLAATVIISSRERQAMLVDAVDAVVTSSRVPRELIVVDQSERPHAGLSELGAVRACRVRYVHSATRGVSAGRNVALQLASEDVVVVLDDDMTVTGDSLERLIAAQAAGGGRSISTGRLLATAPEAPGLAQPPAALVTRGEPAVFRGRQPRQVVPGPNIALPRRAVCDIGGYDERLGPGSRFPAGEDHDLSLRLLDAGLEVRHVPDAIALHRAWRAPRDLIRLRWRYARGVGGFYAKHASVRDRHALSLALRDVMHRMIKAVVSVPSSPRTSAAELLSVAGLVSGGLEWTLRYRLGPSRPNDT